MSQQPAIELEATPAVIPASVPGAFTDNSRTNAAFEKRLEEIQSVGDDALAPLNLDIEKAITTVFGALRQIAAHKKAISTLPWVDQYRIDGLEDYTRAAMEAQSRWALATAPPKDVVALNARALVMRGLLRSDARALAKRGLIERERLASFKGHVGYKNVGFELVAWADLMRDCWPAIRGKTAITVAEVQQAKHVGERLIYAAGVREHAPRVQTDAAKLRQQAFTLMLNAYDETRRAISFLRWREGDADTIAPSLYAGRRRSARVSRVGDGAVAEGRGIPAGVPLVAEARSRRSGEIGRRQLYVGDAASSAAVIDLARAGRKGQASGHDSVGAQRTTCSSSDGSTRSVNERTGASFQAVPADDGFTDDESQRGMRSGTAGTLLHQCDLVCQSAPIQ